MLDTNFVAYYRRKAGAKNGTFQFFDSAEAIADFVAGCQHLPNFSYKVYIRDEEQEQEFERLKSERIEMLHQRRLDALNKLTPEERTALGLGTD